LQRWIFDQIELIGTLARMHTKEIKKPEFDNVFSDISNLPSYQDILTECLFEKKIGITLTDEKTAGYAAIAAAECYRRLGKKKQAILNTKFSIECFTEIGNKSGIALAYWEKGTIHRHEADYFKAIKELNKSYLLSKQSGDVDISVYSLAGVAETTRILGYYDISIKQHNEVYNLFQKLNDYRGIVWALEGIAQIQKNRDMPHMSLKLFIEASKIAKSIGDLRGLAYALKGIGGILALYRNYEMALKQTRESIKIFKLINYPVGQGFSMITAADIHRRKGSYGASINFYEQAIDIFESISDRRGLAFANYELGKLWLDLDFELLAIAALIKARRLFQENLLSKYVAKIDFLEQKHW